MGPLMICKAVQVILRGRPTGSQGIKGWAYRFSGGQGVGYRVPGSQGIGLESLRGSRGRPTGSQVVKGQGTGSQGVKG